MTLATLHTNDAVSAIARLYKMGVEPFLLAYSINIVLSQRLMRKLCDRCKTIVEDPDREALLKLGMKEEEMAKHKIYRAVGCSNCLKGFKGRRAIHEALYFTKAVRQLVLKAGESIDEEALREQASKEGMHTLRMSALDLLKNGITTLEEVASVTVEDD